MRLIQVIFIMASVCVSSMAYAAPKVTEVMKQIDHVMEMIKDISVKVSIVQNKARQGVKNYEYLFFRRDETDEFLLVLTAPDTEKGNRYLRVGDNFWMYRQNTRTFQHIS